MTAVTERGRGGNTRSGSAESPAGRFPRSVTALDALHRARLAWEATQPQYTFDPHVLYPDALAKGPGQPTSSFPRVGQPWPLCERVHGNAALQTVGVHGAGARSLSSMAPPTSVPAAASAGR